MKLGIFLALVALASLLPAADVTVRIDAAPETTALEVTRLDFLVTECALLRADGTAVRPPGQAAFLSLTRGANAFTLAGAPEGDYTGLAFRVGVPAGQNHADPASWPANHPLNQAVNGLHWSWKGGYVFFALEGRAAAPGRAEKQAFSHHLANDGNLMTVRLAGNISVRGATELHLALDLARVYRGTAISRAAGTDSTHSAENDTLAPQLCRNVEQAFTLQAVTRTAATGERRVSVPTPRPPGTTAVELTLPATFPRPTLPADNPLTAEGVALGRRLFSERTLSADGSMSCATCHDPARAFASNDRLNLGVDGHPGTRNAPTLVNLAWSRDFAWDGRRSRLRDQAVAPVTDPVEMHQPLPVALGALRATAGYDEAFAAAFGSPGITAERLGLALEQYLLTLVAGDSRFDRSLGGEAPLTPEEARGFELFMTECDPVRGRFGADCFHCHGGPLFGDFAPHDTGLDAVPTDAGRFAATGRETDRGKFKTPSLRNVALTAPYMHDGRFATLEEAVAHYAGGVKDSPNLDPNLAKHGTPGLRLSAEDQRALVAFLKTLTDLPETGPR